jgi:thioredoxin 1
MSQSFELKQNQFGEMVLKSKIPVLVDFWAPHCAPCRLVEPVVDELAAEYKGRASFYRVNRDDDPAVAMRYGVMSIPALILFINGQPFTSLTGFNKDTKRELREKINAVLQMKGR